MTRFVFVTGTDTGVGKTLMTAALLLSARHQGQTALAVKPVAAGGIRRDARWWNDDVTLFRRLCPALDPAELNPVDLELPVAPHIAAAREGRTIEIAPLAAGVRAVADRHRPDVLLVEGAGGWLVPVNARETLADLAAALRAEVVLVVGLRLGCLNHALLTASAVRAAGLSLAGWIANHLETPMAAAAENVRALEERLQAPRLGTVPWLGAGASPESAVGWLDTAFLRSHAR